ncbi:hypothetical protein Tco_0752415, partial [Tanacetum coccineum]
DLLESSKSSIFLNNSSFTFKSFCFILLFTLSHQIKNPNIKHKNFEEVQKLYEREKKWIDDFKPIDDDSKQQAERQQKRIHDCTPMDSEKEAQKSEEKAAEYEKEKEELRLSLKIISNDDSEVDYEPLSRKFPIMNWEYQLLGKMEAKDICGVHTLFMDSTAMEINMLVEKKYPLIKELLEKMLNLQLEAEEESTMAFELIKFIKSLIEE